MIKLVIQQKIANKEQILHILYSGDVDDKWVVDSCATHPMTLSTTHFTEFSTNEVIERIFIGYSSPLHITHVGSIILHTPQGSLLFNNVI